MTSEERPCDQEFINDSFNKKFQLSNQSLWILPSAEELFTHDKWKVNELQQIKQSLNETKSKLNSFSLKLWHSHTMSTNIAKKVKYRLKREVDPEFLTQAWCKFYEIVSTYKIIPEEVSKTKVLNSVHLCEAPGAFVASLNHYLQTNLRDIKWKWLATSLNPYYEGNSVSETVMDDRFILPTFNNWYFGEDFTGNLLSRENLNGLMERATHPVSIVTADGSVDCQGNPAEQESMVGRLHFTEAVTALHLLSRGGTLVLKLFTTYECDTVCLLYLLCCVFETVEVFKPVTSKEGNSEVYLIGLNYQTCDKSFLEALLIQVESAEDKAMFGLKVLPQEFINKVIQCAEIFKDLQVKVLNRNVENFEETHENYNSTVWTKQQEVIAAEFMTRYRLKRINKYLVARRRRTQRPSMNIKKPEEIGSYDDRLAEADLSKDEVVLRMEASLQAEYSFWPSLLHIWADTPHINELDVELIFGRKLLEVKSSKFCNGGQLKIKNALEQLLPASIFERLSSEYLKSTSEFWNDAICCDVSGLPWSSNVHDAQIKALEKIIDVTETIQPSETLLLFGLPLLTQFCVGVLYILSSMFREIGFCYPNTFGTCVILKTFQGGQDREILQRIATEIQNQPSHLSLIAILPVETLCREPWYKNITIFNRELLKSTCLKVIENHKENIMNYLTK